VTEDGFWDIVEDCRAGSDGSFAEQVRLQRERLLALPLDELLSFNEHWEAANDKAYAWAIWDAAYLLCNGCGDDSFMDFRAWLVGQGRAVFERVIADPDSLADLAHLKDDADGGDAERFGGLVIAVHQEMTGDWRLPRAGSAALEGPFGESANVEDEQLARSRFPRLAEFYYAQRAQRYQL
jgi:hypothetical protein